ncbi:MAG: 50S ribosomal protein L25/general stress protein Ctc [Salinivirgaceae bacterium]|jgi:large subunit ribosomal protein L25|nr:50S ribosomal protein L25/general stress protein Ctc [Salinivirgaceae bacterium]
MKTFDIKGTERKEVGKKSTKELRKNGLVPCVVYGGGKNVHFAVEAKAFQYLIYTPNVYIVNVDVDGKKSQALMQDIQFHSVSDEVEHVDFLEIAEDRLVNIAIPVKLNGLAEGVKQGGKLMLKLRKLKVRGFAKDFPDTIDIDVKDLMLGKSIKVSELNFDNLELLDPKNSVVATVRLTRSAMSAKGAEGEEGTEEAE